MNPITKARVFNEIKKRVFELLDKNKIQPETSDQILWFIEKYFDFVNTPEQIKQFYTQICVNFPELLVIKKKFEMEENERIDKQISIMINNIMEKYSDNMELISEILEKTWSIWLDWKKDITILEELKKRFPNECPPDIDEEIPEIVSR